MKPGAISIHVEYDVKFVLHFAYQSLQFTDPLDIVFWVQVFLDKLRQRSKTMHDVDRKNRPNNV